VTDLERLFRRLVDNLIAIDPARLHRPISLGEINRTIVPYRVNRRSLALDTNEDYDMLLLRLCAGEGGFVRMVSDEVRAVFEAESREANPNLRLIEELADAELTLSTEPLAHALGPDPETGYAPPEEDYLDEGTAEEPEAPAAPGTGADQSAPAPFTFEPEPPPPASPPGPRLVQDSPTTPLRDSVNRCPFCGGRLPTGRTVNFCPHCGQNQSFTRCPECQSELELGWRHCVNCGHFVGEA